MDETFILAIDQGTTGTTVLVVDADGRIRARAYAPIEQHYPQPGRVEHDARHLWARSLAAIAEALGRAGVPARRIAAIGITNQRETTVLWDRASGAPVARAIVWQDRRTADRCRELREQGLQEFVRERTGLLLDPYFSATKLEWLLRSDPDIRARADAGRLAFGTVDSWLIWNLTGGRVHATDVSNAARTLLFDIHRVAWDDALLALFGVPEGVLPQVRSSSGACAQTDPDAFFGVGGVPIAGIAGDQQAALFGQACHAPGLAKNTYGTGSFLLMHTGREPVASRCDLLTTIAWRIGDEPVEYALEGSVFVTGAAVQWLRDGLGIVAEAAETETLARSLAGNDGVYFVPALAGLGAPHWDANARGLLVGITRGTGRAHLARAVLESIAYQTRDVADAMQTDSGIPLATLRCDGGASVNGFLMQFQADVLGVAVEVPDVVETTALGAAYLAGLGIGLWPDRAGIAAKWSRARRYEPAMPAAERDRLHRRWLDAVRRSAGWARDDG